LRPKLREAAALAPDLNNVRNELEIKEILENPEAEKGHRM